MYVHATGLATDGPLIEDDRVSFVTEIDRRTNKPKAVNVVRRADEQGTLPASVEESTVVEAIAEQPNEAKTSEKTAEAEAFQRARLKFQLEQKAKDDAAAKVAEEKAAKEAEEKRLAGEAAVAAVAKAAAEEAAAKEAEEKRLAEEAAAAAAAAKAAAEEAAAKEAEEKRLAEEAAAAKAAAEEAAAKKAEEKRLAEEEAARIAEMETEEAMAKELGYPSLEIMKARQQPKSTEEEAALAGKYGAMELGERAFAILADLGMIDLHPDPDDPSRDTSKDDEDVECM